MSLDPITAGIDLITTIVSSVWPNKTAEEQAKLAAALAENENFTALMQGQMAVNAAEATTGSTFLGGWRPAVGWVCAAAFAWQFVALPILLFVGSALGHPIALPAFDVTEMGTVLMGMLGMSGLHTYENIQSKR